MDKEIQYIGEWWVPSLDGMFGSRKYKGTLTISDEITLEILWVPNDGTTSIYHQNEVIWGECHFLHFTLFNCSFKSRDTFSKTILHVEAVLTDIWVNSAHEKVFNKCVVKFPYLRNWARPSLDYFDMSINQIWDMTLNSRSPIVTSKFDGVQISLNENFIKQAFDFKFVFEMDTFLMIISEKKLSVIDCFNLVAEFSQFLSIALFSEQNPNHMVFGDNIVSINNPLQATNKKSKFIFSKQISQSPRNALIKFDKFKDKIPSMLEVWHKHYKNHSPISNYLIKSINDQGIFDAPDFLIVIQALEGYFKRFINKKDGKNTKKLEDELTKMIEKFNSVELIKKCDFDVKQIRDTRDYYTHFMPDEEEDGKNIAELGDELYNLTQKCKILLSCCILDMLGLNTEEINICFKDSPLESILHKFCF